MKYYIGDLCYVLGDIWDEICDLTISDDKLLEGVFKTKSGIEFGILSTAYGDGEYPDQLGNTYSVDSGSIGIVAVDNINHDYGSIGGNIFEFDSFPIFDNNDGILVFGFVQIDTKDELTYEWNDYYDTMYGEE